MSADLQEALTRNLLQGLYNKLVSKNYIRQIVAKLNLEVTASDLFGQAIEIVKQLQESMLKHLDIVPYTIRALLCYVMPGDLTEFSIDFNAIY